MPTAQAGRGPAIFAIADGNLLTGYPRRFPALFKRKQGIYTVVASWAAGFSPGQIEFIGVSLSPAETLFAVNTIEFFAGGEDERVELHNLAGSSLFFATDVAVPPQIWRGDDPAAPPPLLQTQANVDLDWQAALVQDPTLPRWIVEAQFVSNRPGDQLRILGWTASGDCIISGRAWMQFRCEQVFGVAGFDDGPYDWWGRLSPTGAGTAWDFAERDFGAPGGANTPAPPPPTSAPNLSVSASGQLLVRTHVQVNPELAAGVLAFDGPFS